MSPISLSILFSDYVRLFPGIEDFYVSVKNFKKQTDNCCQLRPLVGLAEPGPGARVLENSSNSAIMQAMELSSPRVWWRRLLQKLGLGPKGQPVWGPEVPTILGICSHCGAAVLKGWHRETPEGLLCQRCAGKG
jgi:hypothetical protein